MPTHLWDPSFPAKSCIYKQTLAQQAAQAASTASLASAGGKRKINMASVINQGDDNEVDILDSNTITQAYAEYKAKTGAPSLHRMRNCSCNRSVHSKTCLIPASLLTLTITASRRRSARGDLLFEDCRTAASRGAGVGLFRVA